MAGNTTVYNSTDGPLPIDRAGRILGARERRDVESVDGSPLAGHITAGRILVLDEDKADAQAEDTTTDEQPARKAGRRTPTNEEA